MNTAKFRRGLTAALVLLVSLAFSGCFPGQFPIPPDRSAPPKASKKGANSGAPYFHGGMAPGVPADATD